MSHDARAIFLCGDLMFLASERVLTWPWPWPVLNLALVSYLHGIFVIPSVVFWQGLGVQLSLVWSRQPIRVSVRVSRYESALTLDVCLTRYLILLRNIKIALKSSRWELLIAASRPSLRRFVRKLDSRGDIRPPPANGSWLEAPAPRGLSDMSRDLGSKNGQPSTASKT